MPTTTSRPSQTSSPRSRDTPSGIGIAALPRRCDEPTARTWLDRGACEVHRRRPDEARDEEVRRPVVDVRRRVDLLELARAQDRDAVAHGHRLDLVVRDVDRRHAEPLLQRLDLAAHVHAELGVEVRQRLVHEEHLRLANDRPAHRDALSLAAGELLRPPVEQLLEPEQLSPSPAHAA